MENERPEASDYAKIMIYKYFTQLLIMFISIYYPCYIYVQVKLLKYIQFLQSAVISRKTQTERRDETQQS